MKRPIFDNVATMWVFVAGGLANVLFLASLFLFPGTAFHLIEYSDQIDRVVNDTVFPRNIWALSPEATKIVDELALEADPRVLFLTIYPQWKYVADFAYWDVPNPPAVSLMTLSGDCDDVARFYAHIFHKRGYEHTYYVTMAHAKEGHAVTMVWREDLGKLCLVDVNGWWEVNYIGQTPFYSAAAKLISMAYPRMKYIAFRNWNLNHILRIDNLRRLANESSY